MSGARILLVEDEPGLALTVGDRLRSEGHEVQVASTGAQALDAAEPTLGLILLDVMLPDLDGFEVCRTLRRRGLRVPILMVTARGEISDRVAGLRLGADDYLTKPFDPRELSARVEALLRRGGDGAAPAAASEVLSFGDVEVDLRAMCVRRSGVEVELAAQEFQLLAYLVQNPGVALSRERLLREVWGFRRAPRTRTVDVHITWLRHKLEPDRSQPLHIRTVRGVGYRFVLDPRDQDVP